MDKRYDHLAQEAIAQKLWDQEKIYQFTATPDRKTFSIDTPPPTVSGKLHIGHIFSYTHTDIIARFKRMQGFNVFYPMGFDDNGLPTERFVEKKNSTKAHLMKRSEFIALCLKECAEVEKGFEDLWKRLGLSIDWTKTYSTISDKARTTSQYSFIEMYKKGHIFRQAEPALYCTTCRTSVAQAELDNAEVNSTFNTIEFSTETGTPLQIATTRPELLPACVAVFYHPDDSRYNLLNGQYLLSPVFGARVPLLADDKVDPEKGTGLVMCCTFGDQTDIHWFKKHKLPFIQVVGFDGKWTAAAGPLAGLNVHDARKTVLSLLADAGKLIEKKQIAHNVGIHERCKQEIEYLVLNQWFIHVLNNKKALLDRGDEIEWRPEFMKARYRDWVENLAWDWCISRQRFFGIPFPAWHCNDCSEVLLADPALLPIDPQETQFAGSCTQCGGSNIRPDTDVMDTWNTSALTPQINAGWPGEQIIDIPMSMRPQAHDIIRTWAFDTIVKSHYHHNSIPWKEIVISGHVLAGKEKISKSQENSKMDPLTLLATYPADAIRFWTANGKLGTDTAFSENQLNMGGRVITKLWNAFRFCNEHLAGYVPPQHAPQLDPLNQWLMHNVNSTLEKYIAHFEQYEYSHALESVEKFFWNNFCDNYLELVKDQIFNPDKYDAQTHAATRYTLYNAGLAILQMYAPIVSHATESIYQLMYREQEKAVSLHLLILNATRYSGHHYPESNTTIESVIAVINEVRKLKSAHHLSLKSPVARLELCTSNSVVAAQIMSQEAILKGITQAVEVTHHAEALEASSLEVTGESSIIRINL